MSGSTLTRRRLLWCGAAGLAAAGAGLAGWWLAWPRPVTHYGYEVVNTYPHDETAFTQGLLYADGILYEGTGREGQSTLRKVELTTGRVLQSVPLPDVYFGEGITLWGENVLQLTWLHQRGLIYNRHTFERIGSFHYTGQGWGLTNDDRHLILSDGSATLRFLDPQTYEVVRRLPVHDDGQPVEKLNELEYINGEIWANVWETDRIVRISPSTGAVLAWVDLAGLRPRETLGDPGAVLNGIAYDSATHRLFVTGKLWPRLFEIRLVPRG